MLRILPLLFACSVAGIVYGQSEDIAYVPREAPARTADDVSIGFRDTAEPGIVDLALPAGTYQVDLLNASGSVVQELDPEAASRLDLRALKVGTWTVRAHSHNGLHVRRFVVLGRGGTLWVNQRGPSRR